jgi:hypothetical protein
VVGWVSRLEAAEGRHMMRHLSGVHGRLRIAISIGAKLVHQGPAFWVEYLRKTMILLVSIKHLWITRKRLSTSQRLCIIHRWRVNMGV